MHISSIHASLTRVLVSLLCLASEWGIKQDMEGTSANACRFPPDKSLYASMLLDVGPCGSRSASRVIAPEPNDFDTNKQIINCHFIKSYAKIYIYCCRRKDLFKNRYCKLFEYQDQNCSLAVSLSWIFLT